MKCKETRDISFNNSPRYKFVIMKCEPLYTGVTFVTGLILSEGPRIVIRLNYHLLWKFQKSYIFVYAAHSKCSICILEGDLRTAWPRKHYTPD